MSTTDQAILEAIQYAVFEPPDLGATWPSGLWTQAEILSYMNLRQSRFLKTGQLWIGVAQTTVVAFQGRATLPSDWIGTLVAVWRGADGSVAILDRSDPFEADHGDPSWETTSGTPSVYMDYATPTLQIQIAPIPTVGGTLDIWYVPQGAPLDGTGELFTVQDAFVTAAGKYGTLADMLAKDGRGKNSEKASYCEARYQLGLDCARIILEGWV